MDLVRALHALIRNDVDFVLIGGIAAIARGSSMITGDIDICYARSPENLERLAQALRELRATLRGAPKGLPFQLDTETLENGDHFTFQTDAGDFDCLGTPAGSNGYDELIRNAELLDFDGLRAHVASIDDLIRMKRAAGRPTDLYAVEILGALRDEIEGL